MKVFDAKCKLIKKARNSWPMYAYHKEDVLLRGEYWNDRYGN